MTAYRTRDGEPFEGATPAEAVEALRRISQQPSKSLDQFMRSVAGAAEIQTGEPVRSSSAEKFLADLQSAGLIYLVDC